MRKHLQDRSANPDLTQCHQAQQNKAHVADTRIAHDELEVFLHQSDHRSIHDADQCEQGEYLSPRAKAEDMESPLIQTAWKQRHGYSQTTVCAQLHHHAS